jgi:hypothetical protein
LHPVIGGGKYEARAEIEQLEDRRPVAPMV